LGDVTSEWTIGLAKFDVGEWKFILPGTLNWIAADVFEVGPKLERPK
jgi:hypothetical protein